MANNGWQSGVGTAALPKKQSGVRQTRLECADRIEAPFGYGRQDTQAQEKPHSKKAQKSKWGKRRFRLACL